MAFELFSRDNMKENLVSRDGFTPFPRAAERESWSSLDDVLRNRLISSGEGYLGYEWALVRASDYLEYIESGDRANHAAKYFDRRFAVGTLALAECADGTGRFLRDLIDGLWLICEETSWVIPAHTRDASMHPGPLPSRRKADHGIDLFAAETGAFLSWVGYLLGGELADTYPAVKERIGEEVRERIIDQFLERTDLWWMGIEPSRHCCLNNWTPWCVSNCLSAILLVEEDEHRRYEGVRKAAECLERYLDQQPTDGGCDEGPGYWMAAAGARLQPPPALLYRFGAAVGDEELKALGLQFLSDDIAPHVRWYPVLRQLSFLYSYPAMKADRERADPRVAGADPFARKNAGSMGPKHRLFSLSS